MNESAYFFAKKNILAPLFALFWASFFFSCDDSPHLQHPVAQAGKLDLSQWNFARDGSTALEGEWEFYWQKLYSPQQIDSLHTSGTKPQFLYSPMLWNGAQYGRTQLPGLGYGTYALRVKLPKKQMPLAIEITPASTAMTLFAGQDTLASLGKVATNKSDFEAHTHYTVRSVPNAEGEVLIVMQVANFAHRLGGTWLKNNIGTTEEIVGTYTRRVGTDLFLLGSILIMGLYHIGLYLTRRREISALYFGLHCLMVAMRILATGTLLIHSIFPSVGWEMVEKLEYWGFYLGVGTFYLFFRSLFKRYISKKIDVIFYSITLILSLFVLFAPAILFSHTVLFFELMTVVMGILVIYVLVRKALQKNRIAITFLIGFVVFFGTVVNDILHENGTIYTADLFAYGVFFFTLTQAFLLSVKFNHAFEKAEDLGKKLEEANKTQETVIHEITASLQYAKRIQTAIFPREEDIKASLNNYFILFKPRDLVSGDFYFIKRTPQYHYLVVADCTGHGVPGAFMSMLGIAFLNEIISHHHTSQPAQILDELRRSIIESLNQSQLREAKDGIDISLCQIDNQTNILNFAGAHHSLVLWREKHVTVYKGDRQPIGFAPKNRPFSSQQIQLLPNDRLFLYTDGYSDQLGGEQLYKFSTSRLLGMLRQIGHLPLAQLRDELENAHHTWRNKQPQTDDILLLGFEV